MIHARTSDEYYSCEHSSFVCLVAESIVFVQLKVQYIKKRQFVQKLRVHSVNTQMQHQSSSQHSLTRCHKRKHTRSFTHTQTLAHTHTHIHNWQTRARTHNFQFLQISIPTSYSLLRRWVGLSFLRIFIKVVNPIISETDKTRQRHTRNRLVFISTNERLSIPPVNWTV